MHFPHLQSFRISPYLTLPHVVLFRILEALFKVLPDIFESRVRGGVELCLDFFEGDRPFDDLVVVWVLPFRYESQKIVRKGAAAAVSDEKRTEKTKRVVVSDRLGLRLGRP